MSAALLSVPQRRLLACFFISGAAGLIYQIAWAKALGLTFGHTVYAVTAVLATFMTGLAIGSALFGRIASRSSNPILAYARLEFLVALTGAVSLLGLQVAHLVYVTIHPSLADSQALLMAVRTAASAVVLLIPTFLMGGTFPLLVAAFTNDAGKVAERVSQLYWVNTAGAALGAVFAGFVLLPAVGLRTTIGVAACLNVIAGIVAHSCSKYTVRGPSDASGSKLTVRTSDQGLRALYALFALVGCTAFGYEISWTRMLAITIGSSTYAFTLVLAAFLAGITIGSAAFQIYASKSSPITTTVLGWTQALIAAAALSSLVVFHGVPHWIPALLNATHRTFAGLVLTQFVAAVLTVFPVALILGFNFPLVIELIQRQRTCPASAVGNAYAVNTIGTIAGSLITGLWLIPLYGSFRVVAGVAAVNILLALGIHFSRWREQLVSIVLDVALLLGTYLVASSPLLDNKTLLNLSAVLYGGSYGGRLTVSEIAATKDLVYAADGVNDSIAVVRTDGNVALRVNGKVDASTEDASTQLLLGHLGAALHPSPRRVLVVGLGSGMTASAVARYPDVERIDTVEIEPAVLSAAPYLSDLNRGVLRDPRLHITFDDARDFLLTSHDKYDLIISEPSNPWIAGIATLFTQEFYTAAIQRLRPGGLFVQWVQAYSLGPSDLQMIFATFATRFADVSLWRAGPTDLLLLGRTAKSPLSFKHLDSLWSGAELRQDFESLKVYEPEGLAAYFLLNNGSVRQLAARGTLNTDDRTLLEYNAPRSLLASESIAQDRALIKPFQSSALPPLAPAEVPRALTAGFGDGSRFRRCRQSAGTYSADCTWCGEWIPLHRSRAIRSAAQ